MYLEQSLRRKNQHEPFASVMQDYFNLGHAESVPEKDLNKPESDVFYLPLHIVYRVFDASAKTASGISLNDQLQIGRTVHPPLVDVLLDSVSKGLLSQLMSAKCTERLR